MEKTSYLCGMFQSGLGNPTTIIVVGRKKRIAQGNTYSTTGRSQSPEYIGDRVTKHQNVYKHSKSSNKIFKKSPYLSVCRETVDVMLLTIFTLFFKAPKFAVLSKLDPKLAKKNNTDTLRL